MTLIKQLRRSSRLFRPESHEAADRIEELEAENEALRKDVSKWKPIETAPKDTRAMFVVIGIEVRNGTYTTDPYCVWRENGKFVRWPHEFNPTHWMPLPTTKAIDAAMNK